MTIIPLRSHQCFAPARVLHLPLAPQVMARTRFAAPVLKDTGAITIDQAIDHLQRLKERGQEPEMLAITGPGDPLATPDITLEAIFRLKEAFPESKVGLRSHGLGSEKLAGELARAGGDYFEMLVDSLRPEVIEKLYAWIRPGQKTIAISEGAKILVKEQRNGLVALKFHNFRVCVVTTLYPGYNLEQVPRIAANVLELGADSMALIPYSPSKGDEVPLAPPTETELAEARSQARSVLPLTESLLAGTPGQGKPAAAKASLPKPSEARPRVAVASANGIDINLHLGQAPHFLIYGPREDGLNCLLEVRPAPPPGHSQNRWSDLADILNDCFAVLVAAAGEVPQKVLSGAGLRVLTMEENIDACVDALYSGGKKKKKLTPA